MGLFPILSFLAATVVVAGVGIRMLWIARRTREVPETAFGITCAGGALGGALLVIGGGALTGRESFALWGLGLVLMAAGVAALYVGVWRIYRPGSRWARLLTALGVLAISLATVLRLLPGEVSDLSEPTARLAINQVASLAGYAWGSIEGFRYWALMRRRLALGLADPLTAQRFLFWGIAAGASALNSPIICYGAFVANAVLTALPVLFFWLQVNMLVAAFGMWFSFFPPAFYRRRVAARAEAPAAE